jgi:hypothetical protein
MTRRLLIAVLIVAALPPAASAAPPWSAPAPIAAPPGPRVEANRLEQADLVSRISVGTAGTQLATWPSGESRVLVALDGARTVRVRTSRVVAASSRYARTRILHFDAKRVGDYRGFPTVQLGYRVGRADLSSFGSSRTIGGRRTIRGAPVLAVNESGAAIAAWRHVRRGQSDEIQIATRPAGGRFGSVRTVQRDDVESETTLGVGVDAGGRAVVAYARNTVRGSEARLAVRVVDTRNGEIEDESRVAVPAGTHGPTEIVVGAQPRSRAQPMVVAWRGFPVTEGPTGTVDTAAAVLPAGGPDLEAAQRLAKGSLVAYPRGPIAATVDASGRPVVAWGELTPGQPADQARTVPTVAQADHNGRFGAPQPLDTAGSIGSLIPQDEGLAVGWLRETLGPEGHGSPLGVFVARRGPDGPFTAGELVDDRSTPGGTSYDGLQPPGLGLLPSGGLIAVYADVGANAQGGQNRVSTRPPG